MFYRPQKCEEERGNYFYFGELQFISINLPNQISLSSSGNLNVNYTSFYILIMHYMVNIGDEVCIIIHRLLR